MKKSNFAKFFKNVENNDFEGYINGNEGEFVKPFSELKINDSKSVCCDLIDNNKVEVWVVDYSKGGETLESKIFDYTTIKEVYHKVKAYALELETKWA